MRLVSLQLENIRSYVSQKIEFPEGSSMLSGDIGAGKSTILLAIEFALFGVIRGSLDGLALLRHGTTIGTVTLTFKIDNQEIIVARTLKKVKEDVRQSSGFLIINGVKTECTAVELKATVLELLGYPQSLLTKSKALIYRYTVYTPQEEMKSILFEDAAARLDTIRKVFQIEKYRIIKDNTQIIIKAVREKNRELSGMLEGFDSKVAQQTSLLQDKKKLQSDLEELLPLIKENELSVVATKNKISESEAKSELLNSLRRQFEVSQALIREKSIAFTSLKQERDSLSVRLSELKDKESKLLFHQQSFLAKTAAVRKRIAEIELELNLASNLKIKLASFQEQARELSQEAGENKALLQSSKELHAKIASLNDCPMCMQSVGEDHKKHITDIESRKAKRAEEMLEKVARKSKELDENILTTSKKLDQLSSLEKNKSELSYQLLQANSVIEQLGLQSEIPNITAGSVETSTSLETLIERLRETKSVREKILLSISDNALIDLKINKLETERNEIEKKTAQISLELKKYTGFESDAVKLKAELESFLQKDKAFQVKKTELETELKGSESQLAVLSNDIKKLEIIMKNRKKLQHLNYWLDGFFVKLMDSIERHVMLRVYNEFNEFFVSWFNILIESSNMTARLDEYFTPVISQSDYDIRLSDMSGGEKTSCALAYRLALNKSINNLITGIKTRDLIILDEPTDGFSSEQLEKVREVLEELNLPQVILVSHEPQVESFVNHVFRIVKEENNTSRVLA